MPKRKRKDANHNEITAHFIKLGWNVVDLHNFGGGVFDICCSILGFTVYIEIKNENSSHSITPDQHTFASECKAQFDFVNNEEDVIRITKRYLDKARSEIDRSEALINGR